MGLKIMQIGLCVHPPPINAMQKAFIDNSTEYRELSTGAANVNEQAIRIANEFKPDLIFCQIQAPNIIHPEAVVKLKQTGAKVFNWTGDIRGNVEQWFYDFKADVTLFSNMRDVWEMKSKGFKSEYLEIGFDENIYCFEGQKKEMPPIVFFGNNYGERMFPLSKFRIQMAIFLKSKFGTKFGVYGNGWQLGSGNYNHSQKEEAMAYRGSKIAINVSHFEVEKYSSDRLLRILGTGVPICLCKWYPKIEEDFIDGVHLRTWKTLMDLEKLIKFYLQEENKVERETIAFNGMKLAHEKFTFNQMILNTIKIYNEL